MKYTERMKFLRKQKNITMQEIAEELNIKRQQYARYENGDNEIPLHHFETLCKYYNVSADYLIGFSDKKR